MYRAAIDRRNASPEPDALHSRHLQEGQTCGVGSGSRYSGDAGTSGSRGGGQGALKGTGRGAGTQAS